MKVAYKLNDGRYLWIGFPINNTIEDVFDLDTTYNAPFDFAGCYAAMPTHLGFRIENLHVFKTVKTATNGFKYFEVAKESCHKQSEKIYKIFLKDYIRHPISNIETRLSTDVFMTSLLYNGFNKITFKLKQNAINYLELPEQYNTETVYKFDENPGVSFIDSRKLIIVPKDKHILLQYNQLDVASIRECYDNGWIDFDMESMNDLDHTATYFLYNQYDYLQNFKLQDWIVGVAVKHKNTIITASKPRRHDYCLHRMDFNRDKKFDVQGFITHNGHFVDRHDGKVLATKMGQIIRHCGNEEHQLYSDNLW